MNYEKFFNDNINIAYKILHQYKNCGLEYDDIKQLCLLGLWKAVITYKKDKKRAFSTYAYTVIYNEINYYLRSNRKNLNNRYLSEKVFENVTLEDTLEDINNNVEMIENRINDKMLIEQTFASCKDDRERDIVNLYLKDYKQKGIAEILGVNQPYVCRTLKRIGKRIKIRKEKNR